jgi:oligosaccharide repeat unit polymerase
MNMGNADALLLSLVLIAWAVFMRSLSGTWLQPSAFFALWWCFAGILPLVLAPEEVVGANAMLWLIAASICVSAGAAVGNFGFRTRMTTAPTPATDRELLILGTVVLMSVLLGIGSNIAFVTGSHVAFGDLFDIEKLVVVSNQLYVQRYDEIPPAAPILSQALLPFVFVGPALGGMLFVLRREKRWKLVGLLAFVPAIAVTILQTTKAAVLFAIVLWLSGYFATRLRKGQLAVFTRMHFLVAGGTGAILTVFFFAVSLARMASTDASLLDLVLRKLLTAAFGHMTVFSQWLADYWAHPSAPALGAGIFAGPLEMMGFGHRIPGLFENVVDLVIGETSNIYTAFRPLIEDFGIGGALAVLSILGFIGGLGFRKVAAGKWSGVPLLLIAYYTTMWSPIAWFWTYNSLTATLLVVALITLFVRLWRGFAVAKEEKQLVAASIMDAST